jgi:hypothetical protein
MSCFTRSSNSAKLIVAVVGAAALAACSGRSPAAPSASSIASDAVSAKGGGSAPGVYDLSFNVFSQRTYELVASLRVRSQELILMAHVTDGSGAAAQKGTATFEYCSYKGLPPGDTTRADEAPKEACEQGTAAWARLGSFAVDARSCPLLGVGYACVNFGIVGIPRTVGFRFRYGSGGSAVASGISPARNFLWTE